MNVLSTGMGWIDIQYGGLNRYFADYSSAMKEHGHSELGFIVAPQGSQLSTDLNIKNVTNEVEIKHYLPRMRLIQKHTNQAVRSFQPDVFNPHFAFYTTMVTRRAIPSCTNRNTFPRPLGVGNRSTTDEDGNERHQRNQVLAQNKLNS